MEDIKVPEGKPIRVLEWLVKEDDWVKYGKAIVIYRHIEDPSTGIKTKELQLKSKHVGRVKKLCVEIGQVATPGRTLIELESCQHPVVMKDMCAECGQDLRLLENKISKCARVAMVPNIPELKISSQQAEELGKQDQERLHRIRKLVLLVDLDQTLIHTTQSQASAAMCKNDKSFYTYNLAKHEPTLHTKMRPHCRKFLEAISKKFELQIVTFGSRQYAHKIAEFIDPEGKYFAHRILSRDECINPMRKSGNLRHLFPCGDSMVCIIDDRDDVWNSAPNLILVKKYSYFPGTGDINSPGKVELKKSTEEASKNKNPTDPSKQSPRKRKKALTGNDETQCKVRKSDVTSDDDDRSVSDIASSTTTSKDSESESTKSIPTTEIPSPTELSNQNTETTESTNQNTETAESTNQNMETTKSTNQITEATESTNLNADANKNVSNPLPQETLSNSCDGGANNSSTSINDTSSLSTSSNQKQEKTENDDEDDDKTARASLIGESKNNNSVMEQSCASDSSKSGDVCVNKTATDNSSAQENSKISSASEGDVSDPIPDNDDYLLYLQHILTEIHSTYYEAHDKFVKGDFEHLPDLRGVLPFIRSKVLFDCYIVFTGVIPSNYKAKPEQHKAYIIAQQLGATVDRDVCKRTTHLIGGKKGTAKYQEALKLGTVKFVSVEWLYSCSERWEKVSEALFPIPKIRGPNNGCGSREGTPPVSKAVKWSGNELTPTKTYNPVTGKLINKMKDSTLRDASRQHQRKLLPVALYSSLEDPEAVVTLKVEVSTQVPSQPEASTSAVRTRKPSMAEMMGIGYSLSSNDISEMDREVDDLLSSDEDENNLGSLIENIASSSSGDVSMPILQSQEPNKEERKSDLDNSSSSSEEEFDHMVELLDHEMHYDENSDLDMLD